MFDAPAPASDACSPPPEARAERRMRRLEQMADQGVEIGRLLTEQAGFAAACASTDAVPDNLPHAQLLTEIARSHAQVTRAVALASAIEDRIDKGLPAIPELDRARRLREDAAADKREAAAKAVVRALDDDGSVGRRRRVQVRLDLNRLLDREIADLDRFLARPLPELIARLHRDLGLEPPEDSDVWSEGEANRPPPGRARSPSPKGIGSRLRARRPDLPPLGEVRPKGGKGAGAVRPERVSPPP